MVNMVFIVAELVKRVSFLVPVVDFLLAFALRFNPIVEVNLTSELSTS